MLRLDMHLLWEPLWEWCIIFSFFEPMQYFNRLIPTNFLKCQSESAVHDTRNKTEILWPCNFSTRCAIKREKNYNVVLYDSGYTVWFFYGRLLFWTLMTENRKYKRPRQQDERKIWTTKDTRVVPRVGKDREPYYGSSSILFFLSLS